MKRIVEISILCIVFTLFLFPKWTTIATILFVLLQIIHLVKAKTSFKANLGLLLMPIFYLLYVIGLINTEDFAYAGMDLTSKLSLIVFPVIFSFRSNFDLKFIWKGLILIGVTSLLVSIVDSYYVMQSDSTLKWKAFTGSHLGYKIHTTYLSWFFTLLIVVLTHFNLNKKQIFNRAVDWFLIFVFIAHVVLLNSFAGILLLPIVACLFGLSILYKKYKKKGVILSVIVACALMGAAYMVPSVKSDVDRGVVELKTAFTKRPFYFRNNKNQTESLKARALLWSVAVEKVQEKPMGYGTGDGKNEFVKACKSYDLRVGKKELNPHNQYFQTTLAIGVIGLFVLVLMILTIMWYAIKKRNFILFFMILSMAFHCLFESILELQSGIVFFTLVTCLLINQQFKLDEYQLKE